MDVKFLFDNNLIASLENLIRDSKESLLLISPFIDLDARIKDALSEKLEYPNFKLQILLGKNENDKSKSIKEESLNFFKSFRNVEIRYDARLHAKFYLGDYEYLMTSMNLYNYSLANNIEVGVLAQHKVKGKLLEILKMPDELLLNGIDSTFHQLLGTEKEVDPISKFLKIFRKADIIFSRNAEKQTKISSILAKGLSSSNITVDKTSEIFNYVKKTSAVKLTERSKYYSSSQISKILGINIYDISNYAFKMNYVIDGTITESGIKSGIVKKEYMGKSYIAYPDTFLIKLKTETASA